MVNGGFECAESTSFDRGPDVDRKCGPWDDPVPEFRLKLSASVPPIGGLAAFWREPLSAVLNEHLAGHTVVDLLPTEHRGAWIPEPSRYELVRPSLATPDGKPAGHAGKASNVR